MKRIVTFIYIIVAFQIVSGQRWAYVLNGNAETLSRINIQTGEIVNHITNTGPVPNQVAYYDSKLYVVNSGSASLQVINPANNHTEEEIPLPINSNPLNIAFYDRFAYVSGFLPNSVYKIDLGLNRIVDTFAVGQSPAGLAISGGRLYVCNTGFNPANFTYGQGSVSVLSIDDGQEYARINVGTNPQAVIEGPDGLINVICTGNYSTISGSIHFIDPAQLAAVDTINIGGEPFWPVFDSSGKCYISAGGWSEQGIVFCYDALTRHIVRGLDNPINVGLGAMGMALDSMGNLYCTAQQANSVSKFNSQGDILGNFPVGGGPVSVTIVDQRTDIEDDTEIGPLRYGLGMPYPNPFNSQVVIPILGKPDGQIAEKIEIFDVGGRIIRTIVFNENGQNSKPVIWNGQGGHGETVSTGVYFARLAGTGTAAKLVLLR